MSNPAFYLAIILLPYYITVCVLLMRRFSGRGLIHRMAQIAIPASQIMLSELLMLACALYDLAGWESFSLACLCIVCGPIDAYLFKLLDSGFAANESRLRLQMVQQQLRMQRETRERARLEARAAASIRAHMLEQLQAASSRLIAKDVAGVAHDLGSAVRLAGNRPARLCSNHALDALLQMKSHAAMQQRITFEVSADVPVELEIRDIELCAVFANLIDNAMHAVMKLPAEERIVRVRARMKGRYLSLIVRNSFTPEDEAGLAAAGIRRRRAAATGRLLDVEHGWGRNIVLRLAKSHGGTFESSLDSEGLYVASVVMLAAPSRVDDAA